MAPGRLSFLILEAIIEKRRSAIVQQLQSSLNSIETTQSISAQVSSSQVITSAVRQLMETQFDVRLLAEVRKRQRVISLHHAMFFS
jgi:predicted Zn-dependent protease